MRIRSAYSFGFVAAVLLIVAPFATATAAWPERTVRLFAGFAPGGGVDITARVIAAKLASQLGQPVIVENKVGANGNIAAETVVRAKPDGHALLLGTITLAVSPALPERPPFDPLKDLAAVTRLVDAISVLVVHPSVPVTSVKELIEMAKVRSLNCGLTGSGTAGHLALELFNTMAGTKMVGVPYRGGGSMTTDLLAGNVDVAFVASSGVPYIKAGKVRALAVTSTNRSALLPDLPTLSEAGLPGFEANNWYGLFATAGTPRPVIERLNSEVRRILYMPDVKQTLFNQGLDPRPSSPEDFTAYLRSETEKWGNVVKNSGIKAQ